MGLKLRLKNTDDLDDTLKALYRKQGDEYVLDIDGIADPGTLDDIAGMKRAKSAANEELKATKAALAEAKETLADLTQKYDEASEQLKGVDPSETAKLKAVLKKIETERDTIRGDLDNERKSRVTEARNARIDAIAHQLTTAPAVAAAYFRENLAGEYVDGEFVLTPVDRHGKPTGETVDEFVSKFEKNQDFSAIIKASQGSGSGAAGSATGYSNGAGAKKPDLTKASTKELAKHLEALRASRG